MYDDVLGVITFIDETEGEGSWEFALDTSDGVVFGSMWGGADAPPKDQLDLVKMVAQALPDFKTRALHAIARRLQDDSAGLDFPPGEAVADWLALPAAEFASRFRLQQCRMSEDHQPVLVFATDLEGESGSGVAFDGETAVRVDSGGNF